MLVSSTNEFQAFMFEQLHFLPEMNGNYTCYSDREHPEGGYCCIYCREGCYQLGIADYTIPEDFSVSFRNPARQLRFGVMLSVVTVSPSARAGKGFSPVPAFSSSEVSSYTAVKPANRITNPVARKR